MVDSTLFLRPARRADVYNLARLRRASLEEQRLLPPGTGPAFERRARHDLSAAFEGDAVAGWLLMVDGRPQGTAFTLFWHRLPYAEGTLHAELAGVYVAPAHRGRGIARELCREALAAARARGARHVVVHPQASARAFYASLGFGDGNEMRLA